MGCSPTWANDTNFAFGIRKRTASSDSRLFLHWRNGSTLYSAEIVDSALQSTTTWVLVTGVVDSSYNITLYVNGVSIGTDGSNAIPTDGSQALRIGTWSGTQSSSDEFKGLIDDVRIYNVALTAEQISQLYTSGQ